MFDRLTDRLSSIFKNFSGVVSQAQAEEAIKEIRRSLLEADVHYKVARELCERLSQKAVGAKVWEHLSPSQQVVQIFQDELVALLGGAEQQLPTFNAKPPLVVLVAGLQGSGKTTFCAKLALYLKKKLHKTVGLLPLDCARPAAKEQLKILGGQVATPVFDSPIEKGALKAAELGFTWASQQFFDVVIVDTAGRQQIDENLMQELQEVEKILQPQEKFLVLDAMIGSQGLDVAQTFHQCIHLTGLCLTKLDGDTRGGAALSARYITGLPILFVGVGEKPADLEPFYPARMASRILGMGDVTTLIEKVRDQLELGEGLPAVGLSSAGLPTAGLTLEDFRDQLKRIQNMGPLEGLLKLIPGMGQAMSQLKNVNPEKELSKIEAMINSMTLEERRNHAILNGRRKLRISKGSGVGVPEINRFLKQFMEMQKMMKQFSGKHKMLARIHQLGKRTFT